METENLYHLEVMKCAKAEQNKFLTRILDYK
jgi:hypothetical protein